MRNKHQFSSYWLILVSVILSIIGGMVFLSAPSVSQSSLDESYRHLALFGDVFQRVREEYVEKIEDEELVSAAINGMLTSLDPHSGFLKNDDFDTMKQRTRGTFGGLGIEITMEDGILKVVSPIDDTPAANAGVMAGDLIIAIDDETLLGLTLTESVERMRGPVGSQITITIKRGEKPPFDVDLVRDVIKMRSVRFEVYDDVGYIRITTFSEQTTPGVYQSMKDLKAEHNGELAGIVLDLRNNPGGLLNEAVAIADAFLDQGEIVSTRGRDNNSTARYYAEKGDIAEGLPIVVLINSGSASASEIVAGALKDHERALIMGTRSFGKGSVQSIIPFSGHGAIRLTTARYYTPSGVSIQATGIEPNIRVELAIVEDIDADPFREEDLRGSLRGEDENGTKPSTNDEVDDEQAAENEDLKDYQLTRALDLLHGLKILKRYSG